MGGRYYYRRHGRHFVICDSDTGCRINENALCMTQAEASRRVYQLNGWKPKEEFEPVK